jgi:HEAT repeat protein
MRIAIPHPRLDSSAWWLVEVLLALLILLALGLSALSAAETDVEKIERLIRQLGSNEFEERNAASEELEKIGKPALEALRKALKDTKDAEVHSRAKALVDAISGEPKQYAQLIKDLNANDYATREAAGKKLIEIGKPVLRAVREAAQSEDLEVRRRAESIIKAIEKR